MRSEKKIDKESRHKLAPIALEPYLVKQVEDKAKTAVIVYNDNTVENMCWPLRKGVVQCIRPLRNFNFFVFHVKVM